MAPSFLSIIPCPGPLTLWTLNSTIEVPGGFPRWRSITVTHSMTSRALPSQLRTKQNYLRTPDNPHSSPMQMTWNVSNRDSSATTLLLAGPTSDRLSSLQRKSVKHFPKQALESPRTYSLPIDDVLLRVEVMPLSYLLEDAKVI